jgi:hypothetical protein
MLYTPRDKYGASLDAMMSFQHSPQPHAAFNTQQKFRLGLALKLNSQQSQQ